MAGTYKFTVDPVPEASEVGLDLDTMAAPPAERYWYPYGQPGTHGTVSEPSIISGASTTHSTWSAGSSMYSVSELASAPDLPGGAGAGGAPPTWTQRARKGKTRVVRRRRTHECAPQATPAPAPARVDETAGPQKDEDHAMRPVQRVVADPLSMSMHPRVDDDGARPPAEAEMRDDEGAPFLGHEQLQIPLAPGQNPFPRPDIFAPALAPPTMDDALPPHAPSHSSSHVYDFTEMNDALSGTHLFPSRRTFNPYTLTSGSRTHAKVRQIREDSRH